MVSPCFAIGSDKKSKKYTLILILRPLHKFGAPGFGDGLLSGADGDYADMSVEEFLQKAKVSGMITDEQMQALTEKVEELPEPEIHTDTAEIAGAGASAAFMSYARLAGWTEQSWLDEAWEQSVASFAIAEAAKDVADLNFEAADFNIFDWNAAGGSLVASLIASELGDELGLSSSDASSTVGTSMAISGMSYSINALLTSADFSLGAASLTQGGSGLLGSMASAGAGALGSWAASQVLSSNTNAEAIGAAVGGAIGATMGAAFFPPLGSAVGGYLGSVMGDTLGETWNEVDELFDDGFQLEDITAASWEILVEAPIDFVSAVFGGDEPPPPPTAEVTYEFNAATGEYELSNSYERDGGKVSHVKGAGDQITSTIDTLLAQYTAGDAQLANRHEMPDIKIGYQGDSQYVLVNGVRLGSLNGETMQAAMGEVLGSAVIEGGDPLTNHILYNDELSGGERFDMLADSTIRTTIWRHSAIAEGALLAA